ncbi:MAG: hypothetical protein ACTSQP_20330 [Promethearchaeota archaeon]
MRFLFTFNVGSRDLKNKDKSELPKSKYYQITKKIWDNYVKKGSPVKFLNQFKFEITQSYFEELIDDQTIMDNELDILIFGTEQENPHSQDTYYSSLLLTEYIKNFFIKKEKNDFHIEVKKIIENPSNIDVMYKYYLNIFENIKKAKEYDYVYVGITTGTTAQNSALLLSTFNLWGKKVIFLYKSIFESRPQYLEIGETIFQKNLQNFFNLLKEKFQYYAAFELASQFGFPKKTILEMKIKHYKMLFNFQKVVELFNEKNETTKLNRSEKKKIISELNEYKKLAKLYSNGNYSQYWKDLKTKFPLQKEYFEINALLLSQLIESLKIKWELHEYIDFLGRIFRLQEGLLQFCFEIISKTTTDNFKGEISYEKYQDLINLGFLEDKSSLNDYDKNQLVELEYGHFIKWILENFNYDDLKNLKIKDLSPNRMVLSMILNKIFNKKDQFNHPGVNIIEKGIFPIIKDINNLSNMRNKSPIAHEFMPSSKELILKEIKYEDENLFLNNLSKIKTKLNVIINKFFNN